MGKRLLLIVIGIVVVGVVGFILYSQTPENQAKSVINERLDSLKTGRSNPFNTFDVSTVREIFINVLNYKYLTVLEKGETSLKLLYDLDCTNRLDQRVHKEVVFTVEKDSQNHYKIVDIRDR